MGRNTRGEHLQDPLEIRAERTGRLQQEVSYRAMSESGSWIWRRGGGGEVLQLAYLLPGQSGLCIPTECLPKLRASIKQWVWKRRLQGRICVIHWRWAEEFRRLQQVIGHRSACEPGKWILRKERRGENSQLPASLTWVKCFVFPNFSLHTDTFSKIFNFYFMEKNIHHNYIFFKDSLSVSVYIKLY